MAVHLDVPFENAMITLADLLRFVADHRQARQDGRGDVPARLLLLEQPVLVLRRPRRARSLLRRPGAVRRRGRSRPRRLPGCPAPCRRSSPAAPCSGCRVWCSRFSSWANCVVILLVHLAALVIDVVEEVLDVPEAEQIAVGRRRPARSPFDLAWYGMLTFAAGHDQQRRPAADHGDRDRVETAAED